MGVYLAECFWAGVTDDDLAALDRRARRSSTAEYLGSVLVREDEVVFCLFGAESADDVCDACGQVAIPFDRVVEISPVGSGTLTGWTSRSAADPS